MEDSEDEVEIPVQTNDGEMIKLFGTLTKPVPSNTSQTSRGMVLFVAGSGALDRNENAPGSTKAHQLNIFNTLARALAKNGVSSFRYDKRGAGKSTGKFLNAGVQDLLNDLVAVMDYLELTILMKDEKNSATSSMAMAPSLILVGHSEGTILSAMASQVRSKNSGVKSLVLICPFVTPLEDIMLRQGQAVDEMLQAAKGCSGWLQRTVTKWIRGGSVQTLKSKRIQKIKTSVTPSIRFRMIPLPALWFREHFALDYEDIYQKVTVSSTLILVAGSDAQCDPNDGERIKNILDGNNTNGEQLHQLCIIDKLSHLLRRENDGNKGFAGYHQQLRMEMDAEVVTVVAEYCLQSLDRGTTAIQTTSQLRQS